MRTGTSIGQMSSKRIENLSTAIVGILVKSSQIEDAYFHQLGLLGLDIGLTESEINWITQKLVKPTPLSANVINDRLPEKYKLHTQQVSRLVMKLNRKKHFPGLLEIKSMQSRKEFFLTIPEITRNQLFLV